jgi:hypothetical protein
MKRREALKSLSTALTLPALEGFLPAEILALGREMTARLQEKTSETGYVLGTLSPHQNETVSLIAELILPETDTPGARAARVNEFIDLMLTEWFAAPERDRFLKALDTLDQQSLEARGKRFKECSEAEQVDLLKAEEAKAGRLKEIPPPPELAGQPFFTVIKWLTLLGYFSSEVGFHAEVRLPHGVPSFTGCTATRS